MYNELTKKDIQLMTQELNHRRITLRPQLLEEVKTARAFGDLSENFEYKAAKLEKNKNERRIRYLENMIKTAKVVSESRGDGTIGLYDRITVYLEEEDETEVWQVVTTVRQDVSKGLISKESPVGKSLLGKRQGDRILIQVNADYSYYIKIQDVQSGTDDGSAELNPF